MMEYNFLQTGIMGFEDSHQTQLFTMHLNTKSDANNSQVLQEAEKFKIIKYHRYGY